MCVTSMVMDHYREKWQPYVQPPVVWPNGTGTPTIIVQPSPITPEEIEEFRTLLSRARDYDKRNNEPECDLDEKRQAILKIAEQLGVEISFL